MDRKQLIEHVIKPVLQDIGHYTKEAEDLLVMIAAHESHNGHYLHQVKGPAVGIFQMEPATHDDIIRFLRKNKTSVYDRLVVRWTGTVHHSQMAGNMYYATVLARAFFLRFPESIPLSHDMMAAYAKKRWNTVLGAATPEDYYNAFNNWK